MLIRVIASLAICVLVGCAGPRPAAKTELTSLHISALQPGKTNLDSVLLNFGEPVMIRRFSSGWAVVEYYFEDNTVLPFESLPADRKDRIKLAVLQFGDDGRFQGLTVIARGTKVK